MKIGAVIQARQGSSRLPGKGLIPLDGKPTLQRVIERLRAAKTLDTIIVATTTNEADDPIITLCEALGCDYYRGSEEDVLTRVLEAARKFELDVIVEITADCPLIDWNHIAHLIGLFKSSEHDHVSNIIERTFPRGFDIRVFSIEALERTNAEVDNPIDRQHVSTWMYLNPRGKQNYKCLNWTAPPHQHRPDIEVTLDTPEDYELINWLFEAGREYRLELTCQEVIELINIYPDMYAKVKEVPRKDYFAELNEYYTIKERNVDEGANLQSTGDRSRKPRRKLRPARKRKPA